MSTLCGHLGRKSNLPNAVVNVPFQTGNARQECEWLLLKRLLPCFLHHTSHCSIRCDDTAAASVGYCRANRYYCVFQTHVSRSREGDGQGTLSSPQRAMSLSVLSAEDRPWELFFLRDTLHRCLLWTGCLNLDDSIETCYVLQNWKRQINIDWELKGSWCHLTRWCYRITLSRSKNLLCVMINGYCVCEKRLNWRLEFRTENVMSFLLRSF